MHPVEIAASSTEYAERSTETAEQPTEVDERVTEAFFVQLNVSNGEMDNR